MAVANLCWGHFPSGGAGHRVVQAGAECRQAVPPRPPTSTRPPHRHLNSHCCLSSLWLNTAGHRTAGRNQRKIKPYSGLLGILAKIRLILPLTCGSGRFMFSVVSPFMVLAVSAFRPLYHLGTVQVISAKLDPTGQKHLGVVPNGGLRCKIRYGLTRTTT